MEAEETNGLQAHALPTSASDDLPLSGLLYSLRKLLRQARERHGSWAIVDFERRDCRGRLTRGGNSIETTFDLFVDRFGKVSIQFDNIWLSRETEFLWGLMDDDKRRIDLPALTGEHADGTMIDVRNLHTVKHGIRSDAAGTVMNYRMVSHDLRVETRTEIAVDRTEDRLEYILPRLRCYAIGEVSTPYGRFEVMGEMDVDDHNELGGIVAVGLPREQSVNLEEYDARVESLLDYLSLANGRLVRWSVRQHFAQDGRVYMRFRGDQAKAGRGLPLFPYMHLRPLVEAALTNISTDEHRRLGLHVAISWSLLNSQFTEANFQGMMTALEHLVHVGLPAENRGSVFSRAEFKSIQGELRRCLETSLESLDCARDDGRITELMGRIGGLNNRSLRSRVTAYLDAYKVPTDDLDSEIPAILQLRNQVVHRGLADDYMDGAFRDRVDTARELLSRIFMTHLRYKGPYESYRGGNSVQQFGL